MEKSTKKDLMTAAVAGGIGAGCFAASPEVGKLLATYGKELAEMVAIIAQGFGVGALAVAGIKLIPYAAELIKRGWDKVKGNSKEKTANHSEENVHSNTKKQQYNHAVQKGDLKGTLTKTSVPPQISSSKTKMPVVKSKVSVADVQRTTGGRAA